MGLGPLFAIPTLIWGSTWFAIKFQLGVVAPEVSVAYRFALAALILAAWCAATGRSLALPRRAHAWMALQGVTMFGLNYVAVYEAEQRLASGLVAVVFSTIVFMTPFGARAAFGTPVAARTLAGAVLGVAGIALLFLPELEAAGEGGANAVGLAFAIASPAIAALGNLVSMRMQRDQLPVLSSTAWGMGYGALVVAIVAGAAGASWTFDPRAPYVLSLLYLAVFGSIVAFATYLTLLKQVGPGPSSFVGVATPVVAMLVSTAFEGYRWTWVGVLGVALAAVGNVIALRPAAAGAGGPDTGAAARTRR
jgi:drug/metabolite transporter (DMT)-like permease